MPTVLIYWSPGRSHEQKASIIEEITKTLVEHGNARREDVLVIFQDIQPGDFGRGGVVGSPPILKNVSSSYPPPD
jgi:4-oxalocrotonate tautomerase family enzyme